MAAPQYSVRELIKNIKRRCAVPTSQLTYTEEDFAQLANDELQTIVVPMIMSTGQEYFVDFIDIPAPANGEIEITDETVVSTLRSVCYVQQTSPLTLCSLPRLDLDTVAGIGVNNFNSVAGFYIQGNKLILTPNTNVPVNTLIRVYYFKRALVLCEPSKYGRIVSIDSGTNTIVLDNVPLEWEDGMILNGVKQTYPFNVVNGEITVDSISAPSILVDTVEGLAVGDYLSEIGYSAIPQLPIEAHAYLAQLTVVKILEGLGDSSGMKIAQAKADQLAAYLIKVLSRRVQGSPQKLVNSTGGLRGNGWKILRGR